MIKKPNYIVSRRSFLKNAGGAGVAVWWGISTKGGTSITTDIGNPKNFTPYILVESNGAITLFNTKPEMGQGNFQSIPALIAEEFEVSLDQVTIKYTNGEKEFGNGQSAGGSRSVRSIHTSLRKIGAPAKEVFIKAAAAKWKVDVSDCYAENGKVLQRSTKKSLTYGELMEEAAKLELSKEPKLEDPKDYKIIGKVSKRADVPLKTNGTAAFGIDLKVRGMLYASVERCPVIGGTLKSFDAGAAQKMPGAL